MFYWMTALMCIVCVMSFILGRNHPARRVRIEMTERLWRRLIEKAVRHYCTGEVWTCAHEDGPYGTIATLVRTGEVLFLPDTASVPAGALVLFEPRLAPKEDRRMPRMGGFEDWMRMTYSRSPPPVDDEMVK